MEKTEQRKPTMSAQELLWQKMVAEEKDLRALIGRNYSAGLMNNTKWNELADALFDLKPMFTIQFVDVEEPLIGGGFWAVGPRHWDGPFGPFRTLWIEWLEIDPIQYAHRGHLLPPKRIDLGAEIERSLQDIYVPYTREAERFRIVGHIRMSASAVPRA